MMRKMKILAAFMGVGLLLAGCGGGEGSSKGVQMKTMNVWMPPLEADAKDKEMWQELVQKFEKDNGVKVNVTVIPWDSYETKYLTGITAGKGPDVGYMYAEMIGDYIEKKQIVDMTSMVTPEQKEKLLFLNNGKFDDKQYSFPFVVGAGRVLIYNQDLLDKAGVKPPTTWEEFVAAGLKLKATGIQPLVAPWGDPSRGAMNAQFFPFVWQAGGDLFTKDGKKSQFNSPEVLEATKYLKSLRDQGILGADTTGMNPDIVNQIFEKGQAAFTIDSDQKMMKYKAAGVKVGFVPSLKHKVQGTFIASDSLVMLKQCKNQELCFKFISYLQEPEQLAKFHKATKFPPIAKEEKTEYPAEVIEMYQKSPEIFHPLPVVPKGTGTYQVLYANLQKVLNGSMSPEAALEEAAKKADAALK